MQQKHLIYAVVENRGGCTQIDGKWVDTPDAVSHYVKRFQNKEVFDDWCKRMVGTEGGKHMTVIKHWRDRPPCAELQAIKKQYAKTWSNSTW